ncbi:CHASE2 domain-containing protein [Sulfurimonas sp.]|uniref:CHASE2 domain-containing protein n=1 Tax=Sulfurimonas sp. TaxID=2022749 RepID=UPI00262ECDBA|nr:CHASE2 domain-containing protein [Sulfurimonas sp.]MCW8896059.1 CHASE2 domain-containing protein [Sulfurimonas sp.]
MNLNSIKQNTLVLIIYSFLFVNGIIYILDKQLGYFDMLHSAMLRNISSTYDESTPVYSNHSDSVVILISNKTFEKEFNSKTPLNKDKLGILVQNILDKNPKSLIFDLDISPDYNFENKKQIQTNLYNILMNNSDNVKIFLPFAFIADTQENKTLKLTWAKQMCENNIKFAFPFITDEIGSVLQYYQDPNHISLFTHSLQEGSSNLGVCNKITGTDIKDLKDINQYYFEEHHTFKQLPVNYQTINKNTIMIDNFKDLDKYNLTNKVVFLGGSYGFGDKYITPYGEKYGVEILNAIYYSLKHKIDEADALTTLIITDVIIGLLFGVIISYLIKQRKKISTQSKLALNNFSLITVAAVFLFISLIVSSYIFHNLYLWLNPVPLIIGMFIDSITGLGEEEVEDKGNYINLVYVIKASLVFIGGYSFIDSI